ncbi:MAG: hypothetical protein FJ272_14025, partial [Planctomycetes bacterium]|nr:hypothetical protein [Planctomycetota bacterium]
MATSEAGANESKMLAELAARKGFKPYDRLVGRHGHYPAERVVVRDPGTGAPIWRLTVDPALNRHVYYDIPAWNANGSKMLFLSCRPGNGIWLMDADGSDLVALDLPPGTSGNHVHWGAEPKQLLFAESDATGTNVIALDVVTGERTQLFRVDVPGLSLCPLLGQQTRMMLEKRGDKLEIYTVNPDGSDLRPVPVEGQLHRLRFTKAADNSIFYNLDNPRTSWVMAEDGSGRLKLRGDETRAGGGHPDWSPDGSAWSFYAEGKLWLMNRDGTNERALIDLQAGGHGGFTRDGQYIVSDVSHKGPFADSLILVKTDGSGQVHRLCTHGASYQGWQSGHPDPEATHPSPNASPDGTKVVFNSDTLGGVCVVVVKLPEPPHTINIRPSDGRVQLNWRRPSPSAEIAGYNVYRAKESGGPYTRVNAKLVDTELYTDDRVRNNEPVYYVITSVEHSGLESRYSHEVCTTPPWKTEWAGYVRHYYEPEAGKLTP